MTVELETPVRKSKEKWMGKWLARRTKKEYLECGKTVTLAKCPKCDLIYETYILWTGRGMPRIYCPNCRPLIAAMNNINEFGNAPEMAKSARKGAPYNFD